ncbi:MAG: manganese efflux pump [Oscillospiraceae bacterium]|nr:manganese efflux pump [Oscillospiraceae bacterium]
MAGVLEGLVLAFVCSIDAFAAAFAYGGKRIRIPLLSAALITAICTAFLSGALLLGVWARPLLPDWLIISIGSGILFILGIWKLLDKGHIKDGDKNGDMIISPFEAVALSLAVGIDGLAAGVSAGVGNVDFTAATAGSAVLGLAAILGGSRLGRKVSGALPFNPSWLGGVILIGLAVYRIF